MQNRMETILANKNYATFNAVSGMIGTFTRYTYEHDSPLAMYSATALPLCRPTPNDPQSKISTKFLRGTNPQPVRQNGSHQPGLILIGR